MSTTKPVGALANEIPVRWLLNERDQIFNQLELHVLRIFNPKLEPSSDGDDIKIHWLEF